MSTYLSHGGRRPHRQHPDSFHLAMVKEIVLKRDQRCRLCGKSNDALVYHHITYERYGKEIAEDLTLLCGECHMNFHQGFSNYYNKNNTKNIFENFPSYEEIQDQNKFSLIPEGTYKFKVISVVIKKDKNQKNYLYADYEIIEGNFKAKRVIKRFWVFSDDGKSYDLKSAKMWHEFCLACGCTFEPDFDLSWLNGRIFFGNVFLRKGNNGIVYPDINAFEANN